ncbi:hypothetical protein BTS2_3154 [Bacillus sp. TS-2]|nr:hypothetical protein BTS2_3154 [Bacillus sp. TS-2]
MPEEINDNEHTWQAHTSTQLKGYMYLLERLATVYNRIKSSTGFTLQYLIFYLVLI